MKQPDVYIRKMYCDNCKGVEKHSLILKRATDDGVVFLKCCHNCNTDEAIKPKHCESWDLETLPINDYNAIIMNEIFT